MMKPKKKSKAVKRVGKTLTTLKQEIKTEKKETPAQLDKKKLKSSAASTSWSDARPSKARKSLKTLKAASSSSGEKTDFLLILLRSLLYCTVLYCTVLHSTVLYCTVLYCTVL